MYTYLSSNWLQENDATMQPTQLTFQGQWTHKSQATVLQLTTDHQMIRAQVHTQCHKSYVRVIH